MRHTATVRRRKTVVRLSWLTALGVLLLIAPGTGQAQADPLHKTQDLTVGSLTVAETDLVGLRQTFGDPLCRTASPNGEFATYVFTVPQRGHLAVRVNTVPSHVDYQHVEGITLRHAARHVDPCGSTGAPARAALLPALTTGEGVALGDPIAKVERIYGTPMTRQSQGAQTRLVYLLDDILPHAYKWELWFEHGRLIEWTVNSYPVFVESAG